MRSSCKELGGDIAFMDFEASGLGAGSWPIEIGWALGDGDAGAALIRPDPAWPQAAWCNRAARVHRISRRLLESDGLAPAAALAAAEAAVGSRRVFSDQPAWDQAWLDRLAHAAGREKAPFQLRPMQEIWPKSIKGLMRRWVMQEARSRAPKAHRACADAKSLRAAWALAWEAAAHEPDAA